MSEYPPCPKCQSTYTYDDGQNLVCPDCAHEWKENETSVASNSDEEKQYTDAYGVPLVDGDTVMLIKNLKVKGTSSTIKTGTKVKNIRLVDGDHDIDCKVDGIGPMKLKTMFVKKV